MVEFLFVADDLALDFVNTEMVLKGERVDTLTRDVDVVAWLTRAGLAPPAARRGLMAKAHTLRAAIREISSATAAGRPPQAESLVALNGSLAKPSAAHMLDHSGTSFVRRLRPLGDDAAASLYPVAVAALRLFTERDPRSIKRCANPHCILLFYDTTKSHTRRWCSMGLCGNRAKVAAFARRRHTPAPSPRGVEARRPRR